MLFPHPAVNCSLIAFPLSASICGIICASQSRARFARTIYAPSGACGTFHIGVNADVIIKTIHWTGQPRQRVRRQNLRQHLGMGLTYFHLTDDRHGPTYPACCTYTPTNLPLVHFCHLVPRSHNCSRSQNNNNNSNTNSSINIHSKRYFLSQKAGKSTSTTTTATQRRCHIHHGCRLPQSQPEPSPATPKPPSTSPSWEQVPAAGWEKLPDTRGQSCNVYSIIHHHVHRKITIGITIIPISIHCRTWEQRHHPNHVHVSNHTQPRYVSPEPPSHQHPASGQRVPLTHNPSRNPHLPPNQRYPGPRTSGRLARLSSSSSRGMNSPLSGTASPHTERAPTMSQEAMAGGRWIGGGQEGGRDGGDRESRWKQSRSPPSGSPVAHPQRRQQQRRHQGVSKDEGECSHSLGHDEHLLLQHHPKRIIEVIECPESIPSSTNSVRHLPTTTHGIPQQTMIIALSLPHLPCHNNSHP
ncbi:hypothetical protein DFH27DRAFT_528010 [Peziza echinospora]|nr:hypothetical protein DFH27DRAFT_528010 [Peziza echinospora]